MTQFRIQADQEGTMVLRKPERMPALAIYDQSGAEKTRDSQTLNVKIQAGQEISGWKK